MSHHGSRVHHAIAAWHGSGIGQPVAAGHAHQRRGKRCHRKNSVGVRQFVGWHYFRDRANDARCQQRSLTTDHHHSAQEQPESGGEANERVARPHAPCHGSGSGSGNQNLREFAPHDHRSLRVAVG